MYSAREGGDVIGEGIKALRHGKLDEGFLEPALQTAEKPQSKLWYNDGAWWGVLFDGNGHYIHKLSGGGWIKEQDGFLNSSDGDLADVLWDGEFLFVLMANVSTSKLFKFDYDQVTRSYQLLSGFPISLALGGKWGVICKDGTGKLWITDCKDGQARVIWSTSSDHRSWNDTGVTLGSASMSSIVSFKNYVGVEK